ncbi:hypothetical protein [Marinisporobacter balticus]|uniref:Uncharacterized protein n=1 Tax=Marinisporobacter balticus TaxID=2018667 RepID=A0A4R2KB84_9FIRM|nr:hypothetical protein [Marinisporobacter balticus]TCO70723.1 hypothetical protein EV214_12410 [Marinisporobacter balticus]
MEKKFEAQEEQFESQEKKEMTETYQVNVNYFGSGRFADEYEW